MLECIFYSKFDNILGPTVVHQSPLHFPADAILETISDYVICPPLLCNKVMTVTTGDFKVVGYPQFISGSKYQRNKFSFNVCFVFRIDTSTRPFCAAVKKVGELLRTLEVERAYLSQSSTTAATTTSTSTAHDPAMDLLDILHLLFVDLNQVSTPLHCCGVLDSLFFLIFVLLSPCTTTPHPVSSPFFYPPPLQFAQCTIRIDRSNVLALKLFPLLPPPPPVNDFDVPVRVSKLDAIVTREWDLTMQHVIPLIDGVRYVKLIALEANVGIDLVRSCIRQLIFYNCIVLIDIFLYTNIYATTPRINEFLVLEDIQVAAATYITQPGRKPPPPKVIFELYSSLKPGMTLQQFCTRYNTRKLNIIDYRFITFGLVHGFIRRVFEYPINVDHDATFKKTDLEKNKQERKSYPQENVKVTSDPVADQVSELSERETGWSRIIELLDGTKTTDEISTTFMRSHAELSQMFKARQRVTTVFK